MKQVATTLDNYLQGQIYIYNIDQFDGILSLFAGTARNCQF